jgi:hypothetical protein
MQSKASPHTLRRERCYANRDNSDNNFPPNTPFLPLYAVDEHHQASQAVAHHTQVVRITRQPTNTAAAAAQLPTSLLRNTLPLLLL